MHDILDKFDAAITNKGRRFFLSALGLIHHGRYRSRGQTFTALRCRITTLDESEWPLTIGIFTHRWMLPFLGLFDCHIRLPGIGDEFDGPDHMWVPDGTTFARVLEIATGGEQFSKERSIAKRVDGVPKDEQQATGLGHQVDLAAWADHVREEVKNRRGARKRARSADDEEGVVDTN
ncbi:MAG: hypothetical protein EOR16_31835 [Mesorhizobium sp.]|uniref:hypothetical protein n=1 Tax=Mesorhizobium sp. TaxID=1871066 RepID=UPI000FE6862A|nr:hypothetical protein [Mesorhizobium sp.]RWI49104.1 MAG: hypothetical protein EOR16_31835 [Mesorhizobium sp.]